LALLLFYPLERARIELQLTASSSSSNSWPTKSPLVTNVVIVKEPDPVVHHETPTTRQSSSSQLPFLQKCFVSSKSRNLSNKFDPYTTGPSSISSNDDNDDSGSNTITRTENSIGSNKSNQNKIVHSKEENRSTTISSSLSLSACLYNLWQRKELYRGVYPIVITLAISNFIFFYTNEWMKQLLFSFPSSQFPSSFSTEQHNHHSRNFITSILRLIQQRRSFFHGIRTMKESYKILMASCCAGIINVLITNPLWVVNMRHVTGEAIHTNGSILLELISVGQSPGGIDKLWTGTDASLLLVSNPILQFFVYNQCKKYWMDRKRKSRRTTTSDPFSTMKNHYGLRENKDTKGTLNAMETFLIGAIAKAVATIVTYPLQLTQSLLRIDHRHQPQEMEEKEEVKDKADIQSSHSNISNCSTPSRSSSNHPPRRKRIQQYNGTWDCLMKILHQHGLSGLFQGMNAKLLQTVLTAAFTFLTYEEILHWIHIIYIKTRNHSRTNSIRRNINEHQT
jgi:solute carrier family 25 (peroxisomal adenine nucleotide transporter), member 17